MFILKMVSAYSCITTFSFGDCTKIFEYIYHKVVACIYAYHKQLSIIITKCVKRKYSISECVTQHALYAHSAVHMV